MTIGKERFLQQMAFLATLASKPPPSETLVHFWWVRLRDVDEASLRAAFSHFGERGVWPTVEQVLDSAGYRSVSGEVLSSPDQGDKPPQWLTEYGEFTFRAEASEVETLESNLIQNRWQVLGRRELTVKREELVGKVARQVECVVIDLIARRDRTPPKSATIPSDLVGKSPAEIIHALNSRIRSRYARREAAEAANLAQDSVETESGYVPLDTASAHEEMANVDNL